MATLETSPEANCDRQTGRMTKPLIGAQATALPKNKALLKPNPNPIFPQLRRPQRGSKTTMCPLSQQQNQQRESWENRPKN